MPTQYGQRILETRALATLDRFDIHVPDFKQKQLSQWQIEEYIRKPDLAAKYILGENLDAFQTAAALKLAWWSPRVMDSSGFSSSKSKRMWIVSVLRCILIPDHWAVVYYQTFDSGKRNYWNYFAEAKKRSRIFETQLGLVDEGGYSAGKATQKGQSFWSAYFKNGSKIEMPAGGFDRDAANQAGTRTNDLLIDEFTKIDASGSTGINDQLLGRVTRHTFCQEHPFWSNKVYLLATAEDTMHPSYDRYLTWKKEIEDGNTDYVMIQFSYKNYSGLKFNSKRSFRQVFRNQRAIDDIRKTHTVAGFKQEALGLWSKTGKGWYTKEVLDKVCKSGRLREAVPITCKQSDSQWQLPAMDRVFYFLGIDPARSETTKAADGALVVMRASPSINKLSQDVVDWHLNFVWAYRIRRADATQWAAIIHRKHLNFGFTGICMDGGGGGDWIRPELAKEKQIIRDIPTIVAPIGCIEDEAVMPLQTDFCLSMFKPTDNKIEKAWGHMNMRHMSKLIDVCHSEMLTAMKNGIIGAPISWAERQKNRGDTGAWPDERIHANKMIDLMIGQMGKIVVGTDQSGFYKWNAYNAREFGSKGRKDFAYAGMYAFAAFFSWMKSFDIEATGGQDQGKGSIMTPMVGGNMRPPDSMAGISLTLPWREQRDQTVNV